MKVRIRRKEAAAATEMPSPWIVEINLLQGCLPLVPSLSAM